ncbi:MAG: hypothetical protein QOJ13_713 [Gaiellales bacterium]|jgi:class 3 adenylate cyclase/tetratricopeptide (TPR) repeat protein|nr:hypothetical protein [Gaiellales bacterium]
MVICHACGHENRNGARYCEQCANALGAAPAPHARKTVTALFCDIVGSTALAERHDPEELRPVMERYFGAMRTAVERHGGQVQKFIGDAVVAVFGVPVAHEDDARRAIAAGLEMQRCMASLREGSSIPLEARIGITTGEVIVSADGTPIIGDAMNTASRLQSAAAPGEILVGDSTWRLTRRDIALEAIDAVHAKGKAEPVAAWRVVGAHPTTARTSTDFVGRERPLRMLVEALDDAIVARAPVLATVLAPPGVGKSRLAAAFSATVRSRALVLTGQTPAYGDGVTFAPLVDLLGQTAGRAAESAEAVAAALRAKLMSQDDGTVVADRLAQILGVGEAVSADAAWAVRRLLESLAEQEPVVVILDDLHWAEHPMLELADSVIDTAHGPVLFLCLARPDLLEHRPTWAAGKPRAMTTSLPPLSEEETRRIGRLLLGGDVPSAILERVCDMAEGNPLYVEQLTAMLADQGLLVDGSWHGPSDVEVPFPDTLHALLAARIDRLDDMRRIALERASIQGRRFRLPALHATSPLDHDATETALVHLERSGFVEPEDGSGMRWRFAHGLITEAAYRAIPKTQRAELHERLADWLADEEADNAGTDEAVARHLERALRLREEVGRRDDHSAQLARRAGHLFATAGLRAFSAVDLITTRDLLGRAAVLLPTTDPRRLDILPNLGVALTETGRADETETLLAQAVEESRAAGSERDALRATIQLLSNRIYRAPTDPEIDAAVPEAERAYRVFEGHADDAGLAEAAIALEYLEFTRGRVARAYEWTHRALAHGLAAGRLRESAQGTADLVAFACLGPTPYDQLPDEADRRLFGRKEPISTSAGHALNALAALAVGDESAFREHDALRQQTIDRHGLGWLGAAQALVIASVETVIGHPDAAERRLRTARDILTALGDIWWIATLDGFLCAAVAAQGDQQRFLRLAEAFDTSLPVPDRQARIMRRVVRARGFLLRGLTAEAEDAARDAVEIARPTDLTQDGARALLVLADILTARDQTEAAAACRLEARELLMAKRNVAAVSHLERQADPPVTAGRP